MKAQIAYTINPTMDTEFKKNLLRNALRQIFEGGCFQRRKGGRIGTRRRAVLSSDKHPVRSYSCVVELAAALDHQAVA